MRSVVMLAAVAGLTLGLTGCFAPVLTVSDEGHAFGDSEGPWTFQISNGSSMGQLTFSLNVNAGWIQVDPTEGTSAGPDQPVEIQVTIDRAGLDPGENQGTILISSNGGNAEVTVTAVGAEGEGEGEGTVEGEGEGTVEGEGEGTAEGEGEGTAEGEGEGAVEGEGEGAPGGDDLIFIHHSVGENWLNDGLRDALLEKEYIDEVNEITYSTDVEPDAGRPDSLGEVPGDLTDMNHWIRWFNDYLEHVKTYDCGTGVNRIVMFKSCFPNSNIEDDGTEPGDPFTDYKTLANYRAVYHHDGGGAYNDGTAEYLALEDVFAANPDTLFIAVTAPPLCYAPDDQTTNENAARARTFNNWLKNTWLPEYKAATGLGNVEVFDLFNVLANSGTSGHPNRLRESYGGTSGDSHPNQAGNNALTSAFAIGAGNFMDAAWNEFWGK